MFEDLEAALLTVFALVAVVGVVFITLLLALPLAPRSLQQRVRTRLARWSDSGPQLLSSTVYIYAIALVSSIVVAAAVAIASLLVR